MKVNDLSIKEKIGQLLCFAFHGTEYNQQLKTLIEDYQIGNIIHFARNIVDVKQVKTLNMTMQSHSSIPLFIGIDQEGGMVRRITEGITYLPGAMSLAAANKDDIYDINKKVGIDLKSLGFNINYAPVADINNNPNNPVINSRSYGDNPKLVSECINNAFKGIQDANMMSTLKHFPGHGDTSVDSHIGLPVVNKTTDEIFELELIPFINAIKEGVDGIMISHILYSKIDNDFPSSLSYKIITNLLKNKLNFKGLITTDSLTMGAIWNRFSIEEILLNGINAGNDILVFCGEANLHQQIEIINTFNRLIVNGKIPLERINESVEKVLKFKDKYCNNIRTSNFKKISSEKLIANSITKVMDNTLLPLKVEEKVIILSPKVRLASLVDNKINEYTTLGKYCGCEEIIFDENKNNFDSIIEKTEKYDKIVIGTYNIKKGDFQEELFNLLNKDKTIVVALRSPYDIKYLKKCKSYICIYDYTIETIKELSVKLYSDEFHGKLPINLRGEKNESY